MVKSECSKQDYDSAAAADEVAAGLALLHQLATLRAGMKRNCVATIQLLVQHNRFVPVVAGVEALRPDGLLPVDDGQEVQNERASYLG